MDFTEALSVEAPEAIRLWFKIAPTWNREGKREKLMHNCRKLLSCHTNTRSVHSGGDTNTPVVSFVFMSRGSDSPHVRSELISFSRPVSLDSVVFSFFFLVHNYLIYFPRSTFLLFDSINWMYPQIIFSLSSFESVCESICLMFVFRILFFLWFVLRGKHAYITSIHSSVEEEKLRGREKKKSRCVRAQLQWGDG